MSESPSETVVCPTHSAHPIARAVATNRRLLGYPPQEYTCAVDMEPWGPYAMGGFQGCTDANPEHCACATDTQPTCRLCDQEIEPGERAWSRQWPCYDTLPLGHPEQDWDVISWHDACQ